MEAWEAWAEGWLYHSGFQTSTNILSCEPEKQGTGLL